MPPSFGDRGVAIPSLSEDDPVLVPRVGDPIVLSHGTRLNVLTAGIGADALEVKVIGGNEESGAIHKRHFALLLHTGRTQAADFTLELFRPGGEAIEVAEGLEVWAYEEIEHEGKPAFRVSVVDAAHDPDKRLGVLLSDHVQLDNVQA